MVNAPKLTASAPAAVGSAWIGALALLWVVLSPPTPGPAALLVRMNGVPRPGWVSADSPAALLSGTGANVVVGTLGDGAVVEVVGPYAIVSAPTGAGVVRAVGGRTSLNRATQAELEALPRVGPTLAARIVAGRPYRRAEDLDRVKGVGPATIRILAPLVEP